MTKLKTLDYFLLVVLQYEIEESLFQEGKRRETGEWSPPTEI
jgi:hypothetical protein